MTADRDAARRPWWRPGRPALGDVFAGLTVALLLVPQSMAYAEIAGLPVGVGLLAASLPLVLAGFFMSSPYLQTGPVALTSLLTWGALVGLAEAGSSDYVALAALLALVVGVTRLVLGLTRLGSVAYLMSEPMVLGFTNGAAVLILSSQLPTALGVDAPEGGVLHRAAWSLAHPDRWETAALALAAMALVLMLGGRRLHRLFPGVLVAVVIGVAYSHLAGYDGAIVGNIPGDLPTPSLDLPWGRLAGLVVPGVVIALVGFAEPASIARTFAASDRIPWNPDQEFVGSGIGNLTSAVVGGFPIGGSFSRSSLNRFAGARTRWAGIITGLVVLAFLPAASVLEGLPEAVLGAIVIGAVLGLLQPVRLLAIWPRSRPQAGVAWVTFAATLAFSPRVERAVILGVVLSVIVHLGREWRTEMEAEVDGATIVLKPRGVLWFVTAPRFEQQALEVLAENPQARRLVLDLGDVGRLDYTGASVLAALLHDSHTGGLDVDVANVSPATRDELADLVVTGLTDDDRHDGASD